MANAFYPLLGRHIRVEHWANALHQAPVAAGSMLGRDVVFDRLPYFFSDQYDLSMEYTGYVEPGGHDAVVIRGDVGSGQYLVFWLADGRLLAGMNVNIWDVTESIQDLIRVGGRGDAGRLGDPSVPLKSLLPSR